MRVTIEHEELVKELQHCRSTFGTWVALRPRDKMHPFDMLMLDSLEKAIAVLQGSTEDKVCISRECAERAITNAEWERDNAEHVADEASAYRDTKSVGYYTKRKETAERDIEELREALEKEQ